MFRAPRAELRKVRSWGSTRRAASTSSGAVEIAVRPSRAATNRSRFSGVLGGTAGTNDVQMLGSRSASPGPSAPSGFARGCGATASSRARLATQASHPAPSSVGGSPTARMIARSPPIRVESISFLSPGPSARRAPEGRAAPDQPGDGRRVIPDCRGVPAAPQRHKALARCG